MLYLVSGHITFLGKNENQYTIYSQKRKNPQSLYLLDDSFQFNILDFIPKLFTITTNNGSYHFNIEILKDTSSVISEFLQANPDEMHYHLNINDEDNVFSKFEEMYEGKLVIFDEDELPISMKITKMLNIKCCPNYMKPESLKSSGREFNIDLNAGVKMSTASISKFLKNESLRTFTISTQNNEYKCNIFGVYSSNVIRDILTKDPTIDRYEYDFNDEFGEFQVICDLFNFKVVDITTNNANSLKEIAEDLQIDIIISKINSKIEEYEKVSQKIDEQETIINSIEELFCLLYNIRENSVDFTVNWIIESDWSQDEEEVHELAAFILQVVKTDFLLHPYLVDLLIKLDEESNETNSLKILLSFVVEKLKKSFGKNFLNCSFVFNLHKHGIISKDEIIKMLRQKFEMKNFSQRREKICKNLMTWFLPELIENNMFDESKLPKEEIKISDDDDNDDDYGEDKRSLKKNQDKNILFIKKFYPDKIEQFKIMRDFGEPDDILTKSLRYDDVDTLQSIISKTKFNFETARVPFNIFEDFVPNGETNYINYAAAYGSIKCFKFLLLNHGKIDRYTIKFAIFGGNIEIIKIVDQKSNEIKNHDFIDECNGIDIIPAIMKHKNDLFDWILEQKYSNKCAFDNNSKDFLFCSIKNGNAHSFIEIVDKGIDFSMNFKYIFQIASKKGFYKLAQLIWNFKDNQENKNIDIYYHISSIDEDGILSFVSFGNLSIFKLALQITKNQRFLENELSYAINENYTNIINYFFEVLIGVDFQITKRCVFEVLDNALEKDNNDIFNFLMDKIITYNPNVFHKFQKLNQLLIKACSNKKIEAVKTFTKLIIEKHLEEDFVYPFFEAALSNSIEICEYFINQKVFINFEKLASQTIKLGSIQSEIFSIIIDHSSPDVRNIFCKCCLYPAISNSNKSLVEYLLSTNEPGDNSLIEAVKSDNLDIVNIILEHNSKPSFINRVSKIGTALFIAVQKKNLPIVKRLLSIPGIDPSLYNNNGVTPLILSVTKLNLEIMNEFLSFYGDDVSSLKWQLDEAITNLLRTISSRHLNVYNSKTKDFNDDVEIHKIIKKILEIKYVDPNCHFDQYTLLNYACESKSIEIVQMLLETDKINVNTYAPMTGNTPLMISIINQNDDIAKLLIEDERTNINIRNYEEETALTITVDKQMFNIIDLLVNNEKFDPKESCLDHAFFNSSIKVAQQLISVKLLDVNYALIKDDAIKRNSENRILYDFDETALCETPLIRAVVSNDLDMIGLIINHPSFDKEKSQLKRAIFIATEKNQIDIFQELLKIENNNVNLCSFNGSLLEYAVVNLSSSIISEILRSPNFDSRKSDICKAFVKGSLKLGYAAKVNLVVVQNNQDGGVITILKEIYDYDQKHERLIDLNQLLPSGESYFTLKRPTMHIKSYVNFLLEHGADPNIPDKEGYYPLEYAIKINSKEFISALIDSGKIDFSKQIPNKFEIAQKANSKLPNKQFNLTDAKYKSYLHLAARSDNVEVFKIFLENDLFDVNIVDDAGETPLMDACRFLRISNIQLLFMRDDLDYLHKNKKGEDAIQIFENQNNQEIAENKESYLKNLLDIIASTEIYLYTEDEYEDNDYDHSDLDDIYDNNFEYVYDDNYDEYFNDY